MNNIITQNQKNIKRYLPHGFYQKHLQYNYTRIALYCTLRLLVRLKYTIYIIIAFTFSLIAIKSN